MRAAVTGASGFIGRHVVQTLLEAGHQVSCLVRSGSDRSGLTNTRLIEGDIMDPAALRPILSEVDTVFHLASLLKMPWKTAFHTVNAEGTRKLAEAVASASTPPVLVVVSSLAAAGPSPLDHPRREEDPPRPVSIYGGVKLAAERAAASFAHVAPISVVRPPMVFGEGDRSAFQIFRSTQRGLHVVPTWRSNHVSLIHARDLAEALVLIGARGARLTGPQTEGPFGAGVYYAADPARPSYAELGRLIAAASGHRSPLVLRLPGFATWCAALGSEIVARIRDRATILNLDKWREATAGSWICDASTLSALGWTPRPLEERLRQTAEWYRAEGWLS